ncbi:29592_t:CDS:2 [Racocetra persica]|uniref:29592_t:CDS:1 n=1 Tax=Racocetra persica TaxID=160502 RepID=A0ACA9KMP2_9GLOM|nr:29592_t:CDS:2 [Racocetra persica]
MSNNLLLKRPRTAISESLKHEICEYSQKNPNEKQADIAKHFNSKDSSLNLDRTTISKILKDKSKYDMIVTELMIKEKAADFTKALNLEDDALKFSNR